MAGALRCTNRCAQYRFVRLDARVSLITELKRAGGVPLCSIEKEGGHNPEDDWKLLPGSNLNTRVVELVWGPNMRLLGVTCIESCYVLSKCVLQQKIRDGMAAVQLSADKVTPRIKAPDPPR